MRTIAFLLGGTLSWGCAGQSPGYQKQLAELRDKVLILQNERDRLDERLSAVEERLEAPVSAMAVQPRTLGVASLPVVAVGPEPEAGLAPQTAQTVATPPGVVSISGTGSSIVTQEPGEAPKRLETAAPPAGSGQAGQLPVVATPPGPAQGASTQGASTHGSSNNGSSNNGTVTP